MVLAITAGMVISVNNVKYMVVSISDSANRTNTRAAMDKAGIKDELIVSRGKNYYSINRYDNGTLGKAIKY